MNRNACDPSGDAISVLSEITMTLALAIASMETARESFLDACMTVWREVENKEPALAEAIRRLGFADQAAAQWICMPNEGTGDCPARLVLDGRGMDLVERIQQTLNGFSA
jgi:hypothetical protein